MLQNVALDSKINLVKVEAENTDVARATASISNEQIDQINRKTCGILGLKLYYSPDFRKPIPSTLSASSSVSVLISSISS